MQAVCQRVVTPLEDDLRNFRGGKATSDSLNQNYWLTVGGGRMKQSIVPDL